MKTNLGKSSVLAGCTAARSWLCARCPSSLRNQGDVPPPNPAGTSSQKGLLLLWSIIYLKHKQNEREEFAHFLIGWQIGGMQKKGGAAENVPTAPLPHLAELQAGWSGGYRLPKESDSVILCPLHQVPAWLLWVAPPLSPVSHTG